MNTMSIETVIFGCFELTLLGCSKYTTALLKQTFDLFIRRLLKGKNLATFCRCCLFGVQINSSALMTLQRSLVLDRSRHVIE
jgi:hypothetical protein